MSKKIALYNSFNFHYEMYGYIINYCQTHNHELVIYTNHDINYNWLRFYKTLFTKYSFRILDYTTFEKNKDTYDHIILATDDDRQFKNEWVNTKTICIDHISSNRRPQTPHHISTRPFNQQTNDWALPCFPIINYSNKITNINEDVINIAIVGGTHSLPNGQYNINVINRLNPGENKKIIIHAISRNINVSMFADIKNTIELKLYNNIDTYEMMKVLETCSYLLTDVDCSIGHITGGSMAGGVPLAFSNLVPLIISKGNNNIYNFKSAIEFDMDSTDDIMLSNDIYSTIHAVELERGYLMSMLDNHLQKKIEKEQLVTSLPQSVDNMVTYVHNTALIIEPRRLDILPIVINQFQKVLSESWNIVFYCGKHDKFYWIDIFSNQNINFHNIDIRELSVNNLTSTEYNDFCKQESLWESLYGNYVLVFQSDTWINDDKNNKYNIEYFIQLNKHYIGGNMSYKWTELSRENIYPAHNNFNGGLSLRNRKSMIQIIKAFQPEKTTLISHKIETDAEDVYFTLGCYKLNLPIGDDYICGHFALHTIFYKDFFGIHNPNLHVKEQLLQNEINNIF